MHLTPAQLQTFRDAIAANTNTIPAGQPWSGTFAGTAVQNVPHTDDGAIAVAGWYSQVRVPDLWAFSSEVKVEAIIKSISPSEYLVLASQATTTNLHHNGIELLLRNGVLRPSSAEVRTWLTTLFPAGTAPTTRTNILNACSRKQTYFEALFAVNATGPGGGNGSAQNAAQNLGSDKNGNPIEGGVTADEVLAAWNS